MKKYLIAACLALAAVPAHAQTYVYACHEEDDSHLHAATLDLGKHTLTYGGHVYRNVKEIMPLSEEECAKNCYGDPKHSIVLATATQGYATLTITGTAPLADGFYRVECNLVQPD